MACRKAGLAPGRDLDLSALRGVGSTGRAAAGRGLPLGRATHVSDAIPLGSLSGGTDVCTGFLGPSPLVPCGPARSAAGCSARGSRRSIPTGRPRIGEQGELVITAPMPSMPVGFWGDADGSRMRAAYFEPWPGVWRHGDWITITERGSCVITGRSDATLNRGGVRLGTAEFYAVVEALPRGGRQPRRPPRGPGRRPGRAAAVRGAARPGSSLDDGPAGAHPRRPARRACRRATCPTRSSRCPAIPRTLSGKKLEVPVKRILLGLPAEQVASKDALADPRVARAVRGAGGRSRQGGSAPLNRPDPIVMDTRACLLVCAFGGIAIGVITSFGQSALPDEVRSLANSAGAWSLAAFLLCLANRNPRLGLVLGPVALAAMLLGYDVATVVRGFAVSRSTIVFWGLAAVVVGPVLGVGAAWARGTDPRRVALGVAPIAGILVGEAIYGLTSIADATFGPYWVAQAVVGLAAIGWVALRTRSRRPPACAPRSSRSWPSPSSRSTRATCSRWCPAADLADTAPGGDRLLDRRVVNVIESPRKKIPG